MHSAIVSASLRAGTTATTRGQTRQPHGLPIVALGAKPEGAAAGEQVEPDRQGDEGDEGDDIGHGGEPVRTYLARFGSNGATPATVVPGLRNLPRKNNSTYSMNWARKSLDGPGPLGTLRLSQAESMARIDAVKKGVDVEALFQDRLAQVAEETEALLDRLLASTPVDGERARPARLLDAMRYASLGGGKRFRPFLVVECATLFDVGREHALMAAAALECVHCYSLAHDDLPAMDDDDLRRGRPTTHKAFDEATAILAGDGLLTFAFDILARPQTHPDAEVRLKLVSALARASGLGGMVGGQMLDLAAEGRFDRRAACARRAGGQDACRR